MHVSGSTVSHALMTLIPNVGTRVPCPACDGKTAHEVVMDYGRRKESRVLWPHEEAILDIIPHLNDVLSWSREKIADWLETLDVDLTFPSEIAEPVKEPERLRVKYDFDGVWKNSYVNSDNAWVVSSYPKGWGKSLWASGKSYVLDVDPPDTLYTYSKIDAELIKKFQELSASAWTASNSMSILGEAWIAAKTQYTILSSEQLYCPGSTQPREDVSLGWDEDLLPECVKTEVRLHVPNAEASAREAWMEGREKIGYVPAWGLKLTEEYPTPRVGKKGRDRAGNARGRGSYTRH